MHPLITEAMKKAAIAWIGVGENPPYAVWCVWIDDALYVVSGPDEQPAPGLADASSVLVTARGDHGGRIVTWPATVTRVEPGTELWDTVAPQLAGKRLNSLSTDSLVQTWSESATISRLEPAGEPQDLPDDSLAAPVLPTPAATRTPKPFRLHRVRSRRR
ncbi:MAG TPA: hypothetical protein VK028_07695 [Micromonosporaceae bacterium]|nr:hypothetical protein [Micromonosporaceae bacterium]